ncbi:hypothetical protein Tco_0825504 [Tanacetum coccineum]
MEDAKGVCVVVSYMEQIEGDVAQFMAKKWKRGPCMLLRTELDESYRSLDAWLEFKMGYEVVSSVIGGILSIKARDMDTKLLSAPESNNTLDRCWFRRNVPVASSGWSFVFAVLGLMIHLVAILTLDSARSCVMQGASFTQGKVFIIPTIFSWGVSISPDSFLSYILLLMVIIVAVVIVVVTVILVVVVVAIIVNYALLPDPLTSGYGNGFLQSLGL